MKAEEILELVEKVEGNLNDLISIKRDKRRKELVFMIYHPFYFDDGDHLGMVLKKIDKCWVVSDEGNFFFHMGIFIEDKTIHSGECKKYIDKCRTMFDIVDKEGELISYVKNDDFSESIIDMLQFFMRAMHVELIADRRQR